MLCATFYLNHCDLIKFPQTPQQHVAENFIPGFKVYYYQVAFIIGPLSRGGWG